MLDQLVRGRARQAGQTEQHRIIAQASGAFGFAKRLRAGAAYACNLHHRAPRSLFAGEGQHRLVEASLANAELRGVHSHRDSAGASIQIVVRKTALAAFIQLAHGV